jgi:hypothetical protein
MLRQTNLRGVPPDAMRPPMLVPHTKFSFSRSDPTGDKTADKLIVRLRPHAFWTPRLLQILRSSDLTPPETHARRGRPLPHAGIGLPRIALNPDSCTLIR